MVNGSVKTRVGVGIATFNGATRVDELLASLEKHTEPVDGGYEIHVLDDGGPDENFTKLKEVCGNYDVSVEVHQGNLGISATWNDLTTHFDSEYMVLLNDDLVLVDDWLNALLYFAENNKFASAGLPMWVPKKTGKPHSGWKRIKHGWEPYEVLPKLKPKRVPAAPGCCFIFKRTLFDFASGFDTRYMSFYEELDFSISLARFGFPSFILPHPWIYHYWARSFGENTILEPKKRMDMSRASFTLKWGNELWALHTHYSSLNPRQKLKWLMEDGVHEALEDRFKAAGVELAK